jgi:hypothetical protein
LKTIRDFDPAEDLGESSRWTAAHRVAAGLIDEPIPGSWNAVEFVAVWETVVGAKWIIGLW